MLLARHALDGGALLLPHLGDVEDGVRPPLALLGLVRLEKVQLRRAEGLLAGIVPPGLGRRAALQGHLGRVGVVAVAGRSEEHTSELQSLMRTSYADFCLNKNTTTTHRLLI